MNKEDFLKLSSKEAVKFALKKLQEKKWTIDQYKKALKEHEKQNNNIINQAERIFNESN